MKNTKKLGALFFVLIAMVSTMAMTGKDASNDGESLTMEQITISDESLSAERNADSGDIVPAKWGQEDNYVPDIRLLVSMDNGETWTENVKNLVKDVPFYLRIEAFVRIQDPWLKTFGAGSIDCFIVIPDTGIITYSLNDADAKFTEFLYGRSWDNNYGDPFTLEMLDGWSHALEYIPSNGRERFDAGVLRLSIPTSSNDRENAMDSNGIILGVKRVHVTFYCTPRKIGNQKLFVLFEYRVSKLYDKEYTLVVN